MKQIAYIELDTHAEIVKNFHDLLVDSTKLKVDYYLSPKILNLLEFHQGNNIFESNTKKILKQLQDKAYDLVILGTAHRYFNTFYKIVNHYNSAIICHNLNFISTPAYAILKNIFKQETLFRIKLLLKEWLLLKNKIYQKVNHRWVLDSFLENQQYSFIPLFFNELKNNPIKNEILTIIVPGTVSQKRRDYKSIISKAKKLRENIKIIFLGKAAGQELEWLKDLEKRKLENLQVEYFTEKIPQNLFNDYMQKADVLWCPVQPVTQFFNVQEIYGKTKISGNIGDAIKYGKPVIFPKGYEDYNFSISEDYLEKLTSIPEINFNDYKKEIIKINLENSILKACK